MQARQGDEDPAWGCAFLAFGGFGMRLVLIRHGESATHHERILSGHEGCKGLSPLGTQQVERLRDRLLRSGELRDATALLTSLRRRAVRTAEIIAPAVGDGDLHLLQDCGLCEIHWGEADGMRREDWAAAYGPPPDLDTDLDRVVAPGGESMNTFLERARAALRGVIESHELDETVVIAGHHGVIAASFVEFAGVPARGLLSRFQPANGSLTVWEQRGRGWALERFNDAGHVRIDGYERQA